MGKINDVNDVNLGEYYEAIFNLRHCDNCEDTGWLDETPCGLCDMQKLLQCEAEYLTEPGVEE